MRRLTLTHLLILAFFMGCGTTFGIGCCSATAEEETIDQMALEFRQRFEGENITLGNDGQVSGTFAGALYMNAADGEFTGYIEAMSDGLYLMGIPVGEGSSATIEGTITRVGDYCFEAAIETALPLEAYAYGCQGENDLSLLVVSTTTTETETSTLLATYPVHTYFGGPP